MKGKPTNFWGKLKKDDQGEVTDWHPLEHHCADVAACYEALLAQANIRKRLARLGGVEDLNRQQIERLCVLAGFHDLGKYSIGFQNKAVPNPIATSGHVTEAMALLVEGGELSERLSRVIRFDSLGTWDACPIPGLLLAVGISHHGRPLSVDSRSSVTRWIWKSKDALDPFEGISKLQQRTESWFPEAWTPGGDPLPGTPAFQHALCGLINLADWIGSDERFFPYSDDPDVDRFPFASVRAKQAILKMGLDAGPARAQLGAETPGFDRISAYDPRPSQQAILELPHDPDGSLTILEAATGAGKTEAALARFVQMLQARLVDGMYFALPTRTAATQIYERVHKATMRAFPDPTTRPPVVLAVPGYLKVDSIEGQRLPGFEVTWPDDDSERFRARSWAAENSKRFLVGSVVVGTIDQVLLSALAVRHSHLRAASSLRHLLVVDEVHASDAYMNRILEAVLARHLDAGGHALLMSATLGSSARTRLLWPGMHTTPEKLDAARSVPYPLLTHRGVAEKNPSLRSSPADSEKKVAVECLPLIEEEQAVAERALESAAAGARVIILRNTVRTCRKTQLVLEAISARRGLDDTLLKVKHVSVAHHARYAREDRQELDRAIENEFGFSREAGGRIAVATQTVQQSLDLDADLLITDLCPMDVLLQRIGRLHRHKRDGRPPGFEQARVLVLVPAERDLGVCIKSTGMAQGASGIGTVYDDLRMLEGTWRCLESNEQLLLPDQCRVLVESALHPEVLDAIVSELDGAWQAHANKTIGASIAKSRSAQLNLARWDVGFDDNTVHFPEGEIERRIGSRLGVDDRQFELEKPWASPLGVSIRRVTIPAWWMSGATVDGTREISRTEDEYQFELDGKEFVYDRLGIWPAGTKEKLLQTTDYKEDEVDA